MLHRFDMKLLHATLEVEQCCRGLNWIELAAEINRPYQGTSSIPINVSTIKWLGRTPESFLSGYDRSPQA